MTVAASKFALRLLRPCQPSSQCLRLCSSDKNASKREQFQRAVKQYGSTVVIFHVGISLASLGFFYTLVSSGVDVVSLVEKAPLVGEQLKNNSIAAGASTFVIAYAVHKVFAPLRISITLGSVPFLVKYLRARGFMKPK